MMTVKNQPLLARAFVRMVAQRPELAARARLVMVGDGPLRAQVQRVLASAGLSELAWLPGARSDVAPLLRCFNVFVLPSQAEGTSCTLQEAMATGRAVVATAVGGTPDLVHHGVDGLLVPSNDEAALAETLGRLHDDVGFASALGAAARRRAVASFSIENMLSAYADLFDRAACLQPVLD